MTTAIDPTGLGTDVAHLLDLGTRWGLASGRTNLAMAIVRRLSTPRGGLYYAPNYGFNLLDNLSGSFTRPQLNNLRSNIVTEVEKDQRVEACDCKVTFNDSSLSLLVELTIQTATGPFDLILGVSGLGIDVLNAGLVGVPLGIVSGTALPSYAGPPGPPGPAGVGTQGPIGPAGPGGGTSMSFSSDLYQSDDSGNELIWWQWAANLSSQPSGTLTGDFSMEASSLAGIATYRLYVGGTFSAVGSPRIGGALVDTETRNGTSFQALHLFGTFTNPTGVVPVVITMQASAAGPGTNAQGKSVSGLIHS